MGGMAPAEHEARYVYHPPTSEQASRMHLIRTHVASLASIVDALCPDSRELALAHTALEQVSMYANAAIIRREGSSG